MAHVLGVEKTLRENGELPVNLIFLFEGEEEIGSPNLASFLLHHCDELRCDVIAISDTGMVAPGVPTLGYGLRGIACCEAILRGPKGDLHSGLFGGAVANPAAAMARLVASLHALDGRVAIDGFYDQVRPLEDWERQMWSHVPGVGDADFLKVTGSPGLFGEPGYSSAERIWARPTAEVNGIGGGYQGEGSKTVLPAEAFVKLSFRLVPDQNPKDIMEKVKNHLEWHCPPGVEIEVRPRPRRQTLHHRSQLEIRPRRPSRPARRLRCRTRAHPRRRQHPHRADLPRHPRRGHPAVRPRPVRRPDPRA